MITSQPPSPAQPATIPRRIVTRDDSCQSPTTRGLFPAGEGAGYAGGIISAAVDGLKCAEALALSVVADLSSIRESTP